MRTHILHSLSRNEQVTVAVAADDQLHFDFDLSEASFDRSGNDLVISSEGGTVTLTGFFSVGEGNSLPPITLADGLQVDSGEFLIKMNPALDISSAAGPASAIGGGAGEYLDATGHVVMGLDKLTIQDNNDQWSNEYVTALKGYQEQASAQVVQVASSDVDTTPDLGDDSLKPVEPFHARAILVTGYEHETVMQFGLLVDGEASIPTADAWVLNDPNGFFDIANAQFDEQTGLVSLALTQAGLDALETENGHLEHVIYVTVNGYEYPMQVVVTNDPNYNSDTISLLDDSHLASQWYTSSGATLWGATVSMGDGSGHAMVDKSSFQVMDNGWTITQVSVAVFNSSIDASQHVGGSISISATGTVEDASGYVIGAGIHAVGEGIISTFAADAITISAQVDAVDNTQWNQYGVGGIFAESGATVELVANTIAITAELNGLQQDDDQNVVSGLHAIGDYYEGVPATSVLVSALDADKDFTFSIHASMSDADESRMGMMSGVYGIEEVGAASIVSIEGGNKNDLISITADNYSLKEQAAGASHTGIITNGGTFLLDGGSGSDTFSINLGGFGGGMGIDNFGGGVVNISEVEEIAVTASLAGGGGGGFWNAGAFTVSNTGDMAITMDVQGGYVGEYGSSTISALENNYSAADDVMGKLTVHADGELSVNLQVHAEGAQDNTASGLTATWEGAVTTLSAGEHLQLNIFASANDGANAYGLNAHLGGTNKVVSEGTISVVITGQSLGEAYALYAGSGGFNSIQGNSAVGQTDYIELNGQIYGGIHSGWTGYEDGRNHLGTGAGNDIISLNGKVTGQLDITMGEGTDTLILKASSVEEFNDFYGTWLASLSDEQIAAMSIESIQVTGLNTLDGLDSLTAFADRLGLGAEDIALITPPSVFAASMLELSLTDGTLVAGNEMDDVFALHDGANLTAGANAVMGATVSEGLGGLGDAGLFTSATSTIELDALLQGLSDNEIPQEFLTPALPLAFQGGASTTASAVDAESWQLQQAEALVYDNVVYDLYHDANLEQSMLVQQGLAVC